jgi:hypothetical protein
VNCYHFSFYDSLNPSAYFSNRATNPYISANIVAYTNTSPRPQTIYFVDLTGPCKLVIVPANGGSVTHDFNTPNGGWIQMVTGLGRRIILNVNPGNSYTSHDLVARGTIYRGGLPPSCYEE